MGHKDFVRLVAEMRQWQKEYFVGRSHVALGESRRLERLVDAAIEEEQELKLF